MGRVVLVLGVVAFIGACIVRAESSEPHVIPAEQCKGQNIENLRELVQIEPCGKKKCRLQKGTKSTVRIRFTPKEEIKDLTTDVNGEIANIPLPFIGVTGTSACGHIKRADNGEDAPCPLKAGVEYIYTNSFPIEQFYPTVNVRVHWALKVQDKDIICFEVPAYIK